MNHSIQFLSNKAINAPSDFSAKYNLDGMVMGPHSSKRCLVQPNDINNIFNNSKVKKYINL